jgi:hypothetical protein
MQENNRKAIHPFDLSKRGSPKESFGHSEQFLVREISQNWIFFAAK